MYILTKASWFQTLIRTFFFVIDKVIYNFIPTIYNFIIDISRSSVLSQSDIAKMATRIYELLAVFMIFKVIFSLIMYVVNPDDFTDKSKGAGKLVTSIVISLSLLILTPYIFNYAFKLQTIILDDNSLGTLILGDDNKSNETFNTAGETMAYIAISPFFHPDTSIGELYNCTKLTETKTKVVDGETIEYSIPNAECFGLDGETLTVNDSDKKSYLYNLTRESDESDNENPKFTLMALQNYAAGIKASNFGLMFREDVALATRKIDNEETYVFNYNVPLSTITGVLILLLLVSYCFDIALRSIKLAFLQLIAPIPIISYVDPKSGKDGLFKKWYQMCFSTYISLFVRLLALYFGVYILSRINRVTDIIDGSYKSGFLLKLFVLIGILMFVKQLPKILEGLGIKLDGGKFTLNPFKKMEEEMIGGKAVNKMAKTTGKYAGRLAKGVGTGALVSGAALLTGRGLRGGGKAFAGAMKGEKFGKNFSGSYKAALDRKKQVAQMKADGVSPTKVRLENFKNKFRGTDAKQQYDNLTSYVKGVQDDYSSYYKGVLGADKVAKMLEQRRIAAENGGDAALAKKYQDAIDERVKTIRNNGNKISLSATNAAELEAIGDDLANGTYTSLAASVAAHAGAGLSNDYDKGLHSIDTKIGKEVAYIDKHFDGKFDYKAGDLGTLRSDGTVDDLKTTNGRSKSAERAITNSQDAIDTRDLYKYVEGKKN